MDKYINLGTSFKNPNDTTSKQGAKFTLDSTAYWNGQVSFLPSLETIQDNQD